MMKNLWLLLVCSFAFTLNAQNKRLPEDKAILVNISYGIKLPAIDLNERYGATFDVGLGLEYLPDSSRLIVGVEGFYIFGSNVKNDPIANLRVPTLVIGTDSRLALVSLRQRGIYAGGHIGWLFPLRDDTPRSGIRVTAGAGYLQHKIRIQDNSKTAIQTNGNYIYLYDHMTKGFAFNQFIGYQHLANNKMINFFAGFEFNEAVVKNIRTYNMDIGGKDENTYLDLRIGFKLGWTLPLYLNASEREIYY